MEENIGVKRRVWEDMESSQAEPSGLDDEDRKRVREIEAGAGEDIKRLNAGYLVDFDDVNGLCDIFINGGIIKSNKIVCLNV